MGFENILQIINYEIFNNQIWCYFAFLLSLLMIIPISKLSIYIINNYLLKLSLKTKTNLDDILIKSLNPPINLFVIAIMFYFAGSFLNFGEYKIIFDKIFNFLIIIPLVFFLIKFSTEFIKYYLKDEKINKKSLNDAGVDLLIQIIRIILFCVGILLILANLGYNISALLAGLGVGGLAFALAAQDLLKNFFAGVTLVFDKTFNKTDIVNFQGNIGTIEELKLRNTKIRTFNGDILTIPNSQLTENILSNITKTPKVKFKLNLGLVYQTSSKKLELAKKILKNIILENNLSDKENIYIYFDEFGDSSLNLKVIFYAKIKMKDWIEKIKYKDSILSNIKKEFEKENIEFAYPSQTLFINKE